MSKPLHSTREVIEALGGPNAVASLIGCETPNVVMNWRRFRTFPANTFLAFQDVLHERGLSAPPELWGQKARPNEQAVA